MTDHPRLETTAPPFVGRAAELAELGAHLARVRNGVGGIVLVVGEPGIGKTRLLQRAVAAHAGPVVRGAGVAAEGMPAFWLWRQVLQACATPEVVAAAPLAWREAHLLADELGAESAPNGTTRYRVFEAVTAVLAEAGRHGGLVVVLDDLQWADEGAVRLLQFVAERSPHLPVLLLCAYRDVEVGEDHPLAAALPDLVRFGPQLTLSGLSERELSVLCRWFARPETPVADEQRLGATLRRQTGGNPFFASEVLRLLPPGAALGAAGLLSGAVTRGGVRAVVDRRLARLPQATYDVLAWAALDGLSLDLELLASVIGRERTEVLVALDPAVAARVLTTGGSGLLFAHDLLRESLLASSPLSERIERHWALGMGCAATAGDDVERVSRAAGHLVAGAAAGDAAEAACWAVRAAERALTVLAYEDAAGWYERAITTRRRVTAGDRVEAGLLLALGSARVEAGQLPVARAAFLSAAALAREQRDGEQLAAAALGLGTGLGGFEVPLFDQVQIDLLEEALAALPTQDSSLRARVQARLSVALAFVDSCDRRHALSEQALAMARRIGDDEVCAYALAAWCDTVSGPDDVDRRIEVAAEVVALATRRQLRPLELLGRRLRVLALLERGRIREAAREVDAFERVADLLGQPLYRWYVPLWRATLAMAVGDLDVAARLTEEAAQLGAAAGSENARTLVRVQRFVQLRCAGRFEEAAALVTDLLAQAPEIAAPDSLEGAALVGDVATGRPDRARLRAGAVVARGLDDRPRADSEWLPDLAQLIEAAVALQDRQLAALAFEALEPYSELFVVEGIGAAVCAPAAHYLAEAARVLGRDEEATRYERAAEQLCSAAGMLLFPPPLVARPQVMSEPHREVSAVLAREGDLWAFTYGGTTVRVRDSKGLRDLAVLLFSPGRAVHVTELTGAPAGSTADDLDAVAITAYRRRLAELEEDVAAAQADHDVERESRMVAEREFLLGELTRGLGLGGRRRRSGDPVERSRKAVSGRIRDSIDRIALAHPDLGRHLTNSVRTGTWCCYQPERPVRWRT